MSLTNSNRNRVMIWTGFIAAIAIVTIVSSGISSAKPSPKKGDINTDTNQASQPPTSPKLNYVPGQVIVKLKNRQTDRIDLLSQQDTAEHQTTLLRLQADYGLSIEGHVFDGAHKRLMYENVSQRSSSDKIRTLSSTKPKVTADQSTRSELLQFYLLKTDKDVPGTCAELKNDPDVEYAQPNYIYERCGVPNDPEFPDQYAHQLIQMSEAWDISTGSHEIIVAVLDSGVDVNHPDLKDNIWINKDEIPNNEIDDDNNGYIDDIYGWNFEDDSNDVIPEGGGYYSDASHGTQVSGVIAGVGNNGIGVCGINWQSSIMVLRFGFTSAEVATALDYATANGAHITNMSFGAYEFDIEEDIALKSAIDNAFEHGILLVASAGNEDWTRPLYPAAYYNVMAVSSTNGEDIKTGHSNFGHWIDIAAPGTDIVTTDLNDEYIATAGTSFSGPYVAAVGALVLAHNPELTHIEVRAILENTTDPVYYGDLNPDYGYIGTGRINAYTALLESDRRHPLGEIVEPKTQQTFPSDGNDIPLTLFVHGDSYQLQYRSFGQDEWTLLNDGSSPVDPNGFVHLAFTNSGAGTFELRLNVTTDSKTHSDRKIFSIELGAETEPWPLPELPEDPEEMPDVTYLGSPLCLDVDSDGRKEIIEASYTMDDYWGEGTISIWKDDGTELDGWPVVLGGEDILDSMVASGLAVGDIDGDGDFEIVVVDDYNVMATALHVESGKTVDGEWPIEVGDYWYAYIIGSPVLADLDGDGDSEIIVALDEESRDSDGLFAIQGDGTFLWQRRYTTEGPISVADFDDDGDVEIALSGYGPGITRVYTFILDNDGQQIKRWRGGSKKGTAIADLDADDEQELVFCTEDSVMAVHIDGSTLWSTTVRGPFGDEGAMSIGDVDRDGLNEVYVNSYVEENGFAYSLVYAFDHEGNELTDAGFPKTLMGDPWDCTPLVGDVDGDGQKELLVASAGAPVVAWESDGSVTTGFPMLNLSADYYTSPVLEDLDQDGDLELIVNGYDFQFHVIDLPGSYNPEMMDWGMTRRDPQNSGWVFPIPKLDPILVPEQIEPGQILEFQLTTSNPANQQIQLSVGNLPEGAYYIEDTQTVIWKPTADQAPYTYTFSFLVTDGIRQQSQNASVTVIQSAIYWADMDTNPNWILDAGWAWGQPTGAGSWNGDPNSGYTGQNVIGFELEGDYADNITETRYATTGAINCEGYKNIRLSFQRRLGVESPYDYANIQVSNDGTNWIDLWTTSISHVSDSTWQAIDYAVPSSVADGQPTVYFRWGIGPTDESVTYPGWNIDDVRVIGEPIQ